MKRWGIPGTVVLAWQQVNVTFLRSKIFTFKWAFVNLSLSWKIGWTCPWANYDRISSGIWLWRDEFVKKNLGKVRHVAFPPFYLYLASRQSFRRNSAKISFCLNLQFKPLFLACTARTLILHNVSAWWHEEIWPVFRHLIRSIHHTFANAYSSILDIFGMIYFKM